MNTHAKSADSVQGFCEDNDISRGMYYKLVHMGKAPRSFKVGSRTLISKESAQEWRAMMEKESNAVEC